MKILNDPTDLVDIARELRPRCAFHSGDVCVPVARAGADPERYIWVLSHAVGAARRHFDLHAVDEVLLTARARNHRFWLLSALRTHTKSP